MPSPYPWHYTLRWPIYFNWPSTRNHTAMPLAPDAHQFQAQETETLRLLFCGDIMVQNHDAVPLLHDQLNTLIQSSDLFIGNCEAPVGNHLLNDKAKYKFIFHMPRLYLEKIMAQTRLPANQWVLSTANNHSGDKGYEAFLKSSEILNEIGVHSIGSYSPRALPVKIIECKGLRLGFIAWTEWLNCEIFPKNDPGIYRNHHILSQNWVKIREEYNLDYLIGIPHWEYEFQHFPHKKTRALAKKLINEMGINLLVGVHTHTLQPIEWFEKGLCAYNLGNLCGFATGRSVKLVSLLEIKLSLKATIPNRLLNYKLHYFYQQNNSHQASIIPLDLISTQEQQWLKRRLSKIYLTREPYT